MITYTDKSAEFGIRYKGSYNNAVFTFWKTDMPKKEFSFSVTEEEIKNALDIHGNSNYAIRQLVEKKKFEAEDIWVENTKDEKLKSDRHRLMYDDSTFGRYGCLCSRSTDSIERVLKELYKKVFGDYPKSWLDRVTQKS